MSQDDDVNYDNTHRAFLQAFLARSVLTFEEAKPILAAVQTAQNPARPSLEEDISEADFSNYVSTLNSQISPFDYEIRSTLSQHDRTRVYALVNTTSDPITQIATVHSPDEIAFVKRVLDAIFETNNTQRAEILAITSMQALKLSKPEGASNRRESGTQAQAGQGGLTMGQAEKMLASLVAEGWFQLSPKGFYSLTPRALMELRGWLTDTYNNPPTDEEDEEEEVVDRIKSCQACKDNVTVGQRCPDLECLARLHNHCTRNMFRAQGGAERCPLCKTAWKDAPPVGEKAAKSARRSTANGAGSSGGRRRTTGMQANGARDEDDDDEEDARAGSEELY